MAERRLRLARNRTNRRNASRRLDPDAITEHRSQEKDRLKRLRGTPADWERKRWDAAEETLLRALVEELTGQSSDAVGKVSQSVWRDVAARLNDAFGNDRTFLGVRQHLGRKHSGWPGVSDLGCRTRTFRTLGCRTRVWPWRRCLCCVLSAIGVDGAETCTLDAHVVVLPWILSAVRFLSDGIANPDEEIADFETRGLDVLQE
eukprot:3970949-Prymnesium_polylepis.1